MEPAEAAVAEMMDETLEEFQLVLDELFVDADKSDIYLQYERIFNVLKKSQSNEKRLMANSSELNDLLSVKVDIAVKMSKDYEKSFFFLREELDKAWKMIEASHNTEKKDRETIRHLKQEVAGLTKQVEEKNSKAWDKIHSDLLEKNQDLIHEKDRLLRHMDELQEKLSIASVTLQKVKAERDSASKRLPDLEIEMQVAQDRIFQEVSLRELQEKELEELQDKSSKLEEECEELMSVKEKLAVENQESTKQLKMREEDIFHLRQEIAKQIKLKMEVQSMMTEMEEQRIDGHVQKETNRTVLARLEKELEMSQKNLASERMEADELKRELKLKKEIMMKAIEDQENRLTLLEMDRSSLQKEIQDTRREEVKQRQIIQQLEEECDRYMMEKNSLTQQIQEKITNTDLMDSEIQRWKTKVSQQENLLERITSENNLYCINLKEAQEELRVVNLLLEQTKQHACRLKAEMRAEQKARKAEQKVGEKVENKAEQKVENKAERKVEKRVEHKAEQELETKPKENFQKRPAQRFENKPEQIFENKAQQSFENKPEQIFGIKREQIFENKPEQSFENKPEQRFENKPEQSFENKPEQIFGIKREQRFENKPEQRFENKPEQRFENKPEQSFENKPEQIFGIKHEQRFENKPEQRFENKHEQRFENKPEQRFENKPEQSFENKPEQRFENKLEQRLENKPEQKYEKSEGDKRTEKRAEKNADQKAEEKTEARAVHEEEKMADQDAKQNSEEHHTVYCYADDDQVEESLDEFYCERHTLLSLLERRNKERTLLYEKIQIHQSVMKNGILHHQTQVEDIRLLKMEILKNQNAQVDEDVLSTEQDLRREMVHKEKELLREKTRNTELREQLNSINCHRWRRLVGSDPGKYELIQKIQVLQKRLITKTQEIDKQCNLLQEKDKLYLELKQVLSRKPGPEMVEQLNQLRWSIKDKNKRIQTLTQELKLHESKIIAYKAENEKLISELLSLKKKNVLKMKRDK